MSFKGWKISNRNFISQHIFKPFEWFLAREAGALNLLFFFSLWTYSKPIFALWCKCRVAAIFFCFLFLILWFFNTFCIPFYLYWKFFFEFLKVFVEDFWRPFLNTYLFNYCTDFSFNSIKVFQVFFSFFMFHHYCIENLLFSLYFYNRLASID